MRTVVDGNVATLCLLIPVGVIRGNVWMKDNYSRVTPVPEWA